MTMKHLLGAAAVAALMSTSAVAQTPAAPAKPAAAPTPAAVAPTPPVATPGAAPATTPPGSSIVTLTAIATSNVVAKGDIVETLKADGHFKTFIKALDAANMTSVLKTNKNLTVFAPTDAAFAALPAGELDRLLKSPAELQKLMTYHVINATVDSGKIKGAKGGVKTVAGQDLILDGSGAQLMANTADIIQADVRATNGTVHVVDAVLSPATAPTPAAPEKPAPETTPTPPPAETPTDVPEMPSAPDKPAPTPQG